MEEQFFLSLARKLVGKQVRIGFISGRNCPLTDGHITGTILQVGDDFFTVSCPSLSSTEDIAINPGSISMMFVPKQASQNR